MRARALGQLLRLSLVPTALADATAGLLLGARGAWPSGAPPWWLLGGSACVYMGALALNDWADREHDARTRPERPIPSGAIAPSTALALALALLCAGAALGWASGTAGRGLAAIAAAAVLYDLAGRGPWTGPLLLAACRAGNLGVATLLGHQLAGGGAFPAESAVPIALYGAYVFSIARLGRMEDGEAAIASSDERARAPWSAFTSAPSFWLWIAFGCLAGSGLPPWNRAPDLNEYAPVLIGIGAAIGLGIEARREEWTRAQIIAAMGVALRRLLGFSAAVALLWGTPHAWIAAGAILACMPLSYFLRRLFPPS